MTGEALLGDAQANMQGVRGRGDDLVSFLIRRDIIHASLTFCPTHSAPTTHKHTPVTQPNGFPHEPEIRIFLGYPLATSTLLFPD